MKIFHPLLCYFPSQAGGPANTLFWLNSSLNNSEFKTYVLSTDFGLKQKVSLEILSKEISSDEHQVKFIASKGKEFLHISMEILEGCNIIQFSSLFFPPTLPLLIMGIVLGKHIIISPRGELYPSALKIKPFKKIIWLRLLKIFHSKIHFHATNEFEKRIICNYFHKAKSITVIPNFVKMSRKLDLEILNNQFLFIGRINPIKNIDLLIKSISTSKRRLNRSINLVIAGSARLPYEKKYHQDLVDLVKELDLEDSITFLGHIEGEEKDRLIASSYALVLPSKSENFGNVVLEALAQGTPVIASQNTPWEALEKSKAGYWIPSTIEAISDCIDKIVNLQELDYLNMRDSAYSLCLSDFDVESNISRWEKLYYKLGNVQK